MWEVREAANITVQQQQQQKRLLVLETRISYQTTSADNICQKKKIDLRLSAASQLPVEQRQSSSSAFLLDPKLIFVDVLTVGISY